MASHVFTGTAVDWADLLDKLITHLSSGTMGSEAWTQLAMDTSITDERIAYLQGPGLSGTDAIHVNIRQFKNVPSDYYNWQIRGAVAYNSLVPFDQQPGVSPAANLPLWQSAIPYWVIANGRRFILIAKVSTTYQTLYGGFILPYATSAEMPYPLFVGASASTVLRWSDGSYRLSSFWDSAQTTSYIRHFDGAWLEIANFQARTDTQRVELTPNTCWPWEQDWAIGRNQDASYGLLPAVLHASYSGANVYGELDGVYFVSGFSNAAEDIMDIGSDDYLVVQSAYRTGRRDYAAIKLG